MAREGHKGIIGKGHDVRLDSERFLHPRLFRLSIFFSRKGGGGGGGGVLALTVDDNFFVPILTVDSY